MRGNQYFGQIVDSATRKTWALAAKSRTDLVRQLRIWKIRVEKETGMSIGAIRIDNATELTALLREWSDEYGLTYQPTILYRSYQNGPAEKTIQRSEGDARAMLAEANLPIEFWDEAVETDTYLRNRLPGGEGLRSENYIFSPEEAFTGRKGQISIDHIKIFGCKCYAYVDPKSLPAYRRKDKLMPRGRIYIFIGYVDETTKQYKVYAPDLQRTIRSSIVDFEEETKGGTVNLNFPGEFVQGTPNVLPTRKPVGRPELVFPVIEPPPPEKLNNFEIIIPAQKPTEQVTGIAKPVTDVQERPQKRPRPTIPTEPPVNHIEDPETTEPIDTTVEEDITPTNSPENLPDIGTSYNLRKRNRNKADELENRVTKRARAMLALIDKEDSERYDSTFTDVAFAVSEKDEVIRIPLPTSYSKAVNDQQYGAEWRAAIQEEIASLQANNT